MAQSLMETKPGEIMEHRPSTGVVIRTEAATLMEVISKAANDPNTDVSKLERLMAMYERITDRHAKSAYAAALAEMQPELPVISERGKIIVRSKTDDTKIIQSTSFARWEDINEAVRPLLAKYGFALSFRVGLAQDGKITVTGILSHREGHQEETTITLPHDSTGSKNAVQAVGSSTSYGKRYVALAMLNITSHGEDDDGKTGGGPDVVSEGQVQELNLLLTKTKSNLPAFLKAFDIKAVPDLPAARFAEAKGKLEEKSRRIAAEAAAASEASK